MKNTNKKYSEIHKDLLERSEKGDSKAQFEIYRLYYKAMYNVSYRIVQDEFEAEDIMQESFLKAFQNLGNYSGNVSFGAWLKKIVINQSLDYLRSLRHKESFFENIDETTQIKDMKEDEHEEGLNDTDVSRIREQIHELPEGYRIILSLYLLEGYDHEEISQILNISSSTSRSQFSRAKKALLKNLKKKRNE